MQFKEKPNSILIDFDGIENIKKRNTASTSIQSLRELNKTKQLNRETVAIFAALKEKQPLTRRAINRVTSIAITNLCKVLFNCTHCPDPLMKIVYTAPCEITKKTVMYYALIEYVPTEAEERLIEEMNKKTTKKPAKELAGL